MFSTIACVVSVSGSVRAQLPPRPSPDRYHWVLPVNHGGLDVAMLHPNDCYRVEQSTGVAFWGTVTTRMTELQGQLGRPSSHRVEMAHEHQECVRVACVDIEAIASSIDNEVRKSDADEPSATRSRLGRWARGVDHRPSPFDHWFGGAYTDIGSDDRTTFRNGPEQRMLFRHEATSQRGNCYEAQSLRTLSIHVRDHDGARQRVGVYRGYLYVEHHHPATVGEAVAAGE